MKSRLTALIETIAYHIAMDKALAQHDTEEYITMWRERYLSTATAGGQR